MKAQTLETKFKTATSLSKIQEYCVIQDEIFKYNEMLNESLAMKNFDNFNRLKIFNPKCNDFKYLLEQSEINLLWNHWLI